MKIILGLICVMLANVIMGVTVAALKKEFQKDKLIAGLVKYTCMIIGVLLMYLAGYFNPDILVACVDNVEVNLISGMQTLFIAGIVYYGAQDLIKLKNLLGLSKEINPKDEGRG